MLWFILEEISKINNKKQNLKVVWIHVYIYNFIWYDILFICERYINIPTFV